MNVIYRKYDQLYFHWHVGLYTSKSDDGKVRMYNESPSSLYVGYYG